MATESIPTPPTATTPPINWPALFALLWQIIPTSFIKTMAGFLLGGWTAGYVVSNQLETTIKGTPKGIIEKFLGPRTKPADAIGQIRFGNSGCSATVIGPIAPSDTYVDILTAAHCVQLGQTGTMKLPNGTTLKVRCVSRSPIPDVAWLRAEKPAEGIPYLLLADVAPPPGTRVFHQGYGMDRPGNREEGEVSGFAQSRQQVQFRLSVSPGDSGGGIVTTESGLVISPVCCTTRLSGTGDVWGGSPAAAAAIRPAKPVDEGIQGRINPILEFSAQESGDISE